MNSLFEYVESADFASIVGTASGISGFFAAVDSEATVREIAAELRSSMALRDTVALRAIQLGSQAVDVRFENPSDAALATYLYLLEAVDRGLAKIAAASILSTAPNTWWARKVAELVLLDADATTPAGNLAIELSHPEQRLHVFQHGSDKVLCVRAQSAGVIVTAVGLSTDSAIWAVKPPWFPEPALVDIGTFSQSDTVEARRLH